MRESKYHFVFCPKYRRPLLADANIKAELGAIIRSLCEASRWGVIAMEIMPDHLHLLVSVPASVAPAQVANRLKGVSARELRKHYRNLRKLVKAHFWAAGYYVAGVGDTSQEQVRKYIANQELACKRKRP